MQVLVAYGRALRACSSWSLASAKKEQSPTRRSPRQRACTTHAHERLESRAHERLESLKRA
eukprot:2720018-Pleurochrysis_carterae.AAC.1